MQQLIRRWCCRLLSAQRHSSQFVEHCMHRSFRSASCRSVAPAIARPLSFWCAKALAYLPFHGALRFASGDDGCN
eukprot:15474104-Alexandrium_andersonii.AAC.1